MTLEGPVAFAISNGVCPWHQREVWILKIHFLVTRRWNGNLLKELHLTPLPLGKEKRPKEKRKATVSRNSQGIKAVLK